MVIGLWLDSAMVPTGRACAAAGVELHQPACCLAKRPHQLRGLNGRARVPAHGTNLYHSFSVSVSVYIDCGCCFFRPTQALILLVFGTSYHCRPVTSGLQADLIMLHEPMRQEARSPLCCTRLVPANFTRKQTRPFRTF